MGEMPKMTPTRARTSGAVILTTGAIKPGMYMLPDAMPDTVVRVRREMSGRAADFLPRRSVARLAVPLEPRERLRGLVLQPALVMLVHAIHGAEVRWAVSPRRFAGARYKGQRESEGKSTRVAYAYVGRKLVAIVCPLRDEEMPHA